LFAATRMREAAPDCLRKPVGLACHARVGFDVVMSFR
jgi:hypothetical protein